MVTKEKNKDTFPMAKISIENLLDIRQLQKIQDSFSNVTELSLRIVNPEGKLITSPSREPRLCSELLKNSPHREKICGLCLPTFLGGKGVVDKNLGFSCHAGHYNFIAPLRIDKNKVLGYVVLGPLVLIMRKPKEDYRREAEELDLDLETFWSAILEIKVITFHGAQSIMELVKDVCEYTLKLAYKNIIKGKEMMMAADSPKLGRILDVLLDVAFEISKADIGSIMLLDKSRGSLTIKSSRGIPEEIIKNTKVKFGEGISGIAAKEKRSFFINDKASVDNRIAPYLKRPYINSSMILPLSIENRVVGVMNLGASKNSSVTLGEDNMKLMNKLISLATVTLQE